MDMNPLSNLDTAQPETLTDEPDYQPLKQLRLKTATSLMVIGNSEM